LVVVGGALRASNAEVYEAILAGREGEGPLCVVPTASADAPASMEAAVAAFATYVGSDAVKGVLLSTEDPSRAQDPSVAADIAACSGFFFTGGAQTRVVDVFLPQGDTTAAFRALWDRWQAGAVVSGSSAGAAMMSGVMIASGGSAEAVSNGIAAEEDGDGVNIRSGMGFFTHAILDQHFLARGRIGRLLVSVLATDSLPVGLGVDENTALVVDGDTAWVAGASGVVVVDGRDAQRTGPHRGTGLRLTLAGAGDVVDLRTFAVRHGPGKGPMTEGDEVLDLPEDPFARWAFLHLLVGLSSTSERQASFSTSGARVRISEGEGFSAAMAEPDGGVEGTPAGFSAGPFVVDLTEPGS
jgi:cyanophycinase